MTTPPLIPTPANVRSSLPTEHDNVGTSTRRGFTAWDAMGVVLLAAVMLAVERFAVIALDTPLGRSQGIKLITVLCWAALLVGLSLVTMRDRPRPAQVPLRLVAVWHDPPRGWVAFLLGGILALPVLAFYSPTLFYDSDSARVVAAIRYVQGGELGYFADTQEPFLPHALLGPAIALRGLAAAKLVAVVSVQVLAGVVSYIAFRITQVMWAAAAAAVGLLALSPLFERVVSLPMYSTALALGYFGGWLGYRAMSESSGVAWRLVVPAGVCLALAPEAQGTGQLFLAVPALLVVLSQNVRAGLRTAAGMYAVMLAVSVPRVVVNLSEGGLSYATSPRADYWITKGYLVEIQRKFWEYPGVTESVPEFLAKLPDRFMGFLGAQAWVVVILACLGWLTCGRGRGRWFVAAAFGFLLIAITIKRIPPFPRYYAPFWPGLVILVGLWVGWLVRHSSGRARFALAASSIAIVVATGVAFADGLTTAEDTRREVDALPLRGFAAAIDDGKGVIGTRAHQALASVDADIPTWGDQFLTEEEYVTFLTWPSDEAVIEMMQRHDIGWVFIDKRRALEGPYNNTWLEPHYGVTARHIKQVGTSPNFCLWLSGGPPSDYLLFKLGPCTSAGD